MISYIVTFGLGVFFGVVLLAIIACFILESDPDEPEEKQKYQEQDKCDGNYRS